MPVVPVMCTIWRSKAPCAPVTAAPQAATACRSRGGPRQDGRRMRSVGSGAAVPQQRMANMPQRFRLKRLCPITFTLLLGGLTLTLVAAGAAAQAPTDVDLHLVLAVDVSGSVNEARFELQKQGYVAAFHNPRLLEAIQSGVARRIAVTMLQWTGPHLQIQVVPWRLISGEASMHALADAIDSTPRQLFGGGTSISGAIDFAMSLFPNSPGEGARRVIDVSGDGGNNRGRPVTEARDEAVK